MHVTTSTCTPIKVSWRHSRRPDLKPYSCQTKPQTDHSQTISPKKQIFTSTCAHRQTGDWSRSTSLTGRCFPCCNNTWIHCKKTSLSYSTPMARILIIKNVIRKNSPSSSRQMPRKSNIKTRINWSMLTITVSCTRIISCIASSGY